MIKEKYGINLLKVGLKLNFGKFSRYLKIIASYIRFYLMIKAGKKVFSSFNSKKIILICALPKSGSTWLETVLSNQEKFLPLMPPEVIKWEQKYGRSDTFIPTDGFIENVPKGRWIIKIHSNYSDKLFDLINLNKNILKVIVLYRDIEEVMESQLKYSTSTKFHPDFHVLNKINSHNEKLDYLKERYLNDYILWIEKWRSVNNSKIKIVSYQKLIENSFEEFRNLFNHIEESISDTELNDLLIKCNKKNMRKTTVNKSFYSRKLK
jgi:hypothetical protein